MDHFDLKSNKSRVWNIHHPSRNQFLYANLKASINAKNLYLLKIINSPSGFTYQISNTIPIRQVQIIPNMQNIFGFISFNQLVSLNIVTTKKLISILLRQKTFSISLRQNFFLRETTLYIQKLLILSIIDSSRQLTGKIQIIAKSTTIFSIFLKSHKMLENYT